MGDSIEYTEKDIDDYLNKLTDKQAIALVKHCNRYGISPVICAWYDNMEDFYDDWVYVNKIYADEYGARGRFEEGKEEGEFKVFGNGEIVRLSI